MRKANDLDKGRFGVGILRKAEHNGNRALAGRHTVTGPEQVITERRVRKHEISNEDVASLHNRLATERLNEVWVWMGDI